VGVKSHDRFVVPGAHCQLGGETFPVADLSLGGFFVASPTPLLPGQIVALDLEFADGTRVPVVGRVAWVNENQKHPGRPPGFGVEVTRIALADKLHLVALLRNIPTATKTTTTLPGSDRTIRAT
jgi:Tfp pilus assembly protein PilZ